MPPKLEREPTDVESSTNMDCRAAKTRRIEGSAEASAGRGAATLSRRISVDSMGEARPRAANASGVEEGSRLVCDGNEGEDHIDEEDSSNDEGFLEDGHSDVEEEGVAWISVETVGEEGGRVIGDYDRLKTLGIDGEAMDWNNGTNGLEWFEEVCARAARNRTIGQLSLRECDLTGTQATKAIATLSPFFELNPNLGKLEIVGCNLGDEGARRLASSLSRRRCKVSLRSIALDANGIGDAAGQEVVDVLRGYGNLRELSLGGNELLTDTCVALGRLLSNPNTKLKELNVEAGQIDDVGIAVLTHALARNTVLTGLNLSFNGKVTQTGWRTFAACLRSPKSVLETLDLSSTGVSDKGADALGRSLVGNRTLKALHMCDISAEGRPLITTAGWSALFACLQTGGSALERIELGYGSVDEGGLAALTSALAGNSTVKVVDLAHNKNIATSAWPSFFACLEHPDTALEEINLRDNDLGNEEVARIARSLRANRRLETIGLGLGVAVTDAGWAHFSKLLCDAPSAHAIHSSNHALRSLGDLRVPRDLEELLSLNRRRDKRGVSREKILRHHFRDGGSNMQELVNMESKVVPRAISWAGRDGRGRTLLYELVMTLPSLVSCANAARTSGGKRKRVS